MNSGPQIQTEQAVEKVIDGETRTEFPKISPQRKKRLLERLKERDQPVLATPEAHGPG
jgi:hypothetical protein